MLFMTWSFKCACSSARQISASDADSVGSILFLHLQSGSAFRSNLLKESRLSPQRAFEQLRVLRDDRDDRPQIMQTNGRNIDAVNDNLASGSFDDAEKSQGER